MTLVTVVFFKKYMSDSYKKNIFYSKLGSMMDFALYGYGFRATTFLNEKEVYLAKEYMKREKISNYKFFGGYKGSIRCKLAAWDNSYKISDEDFEIEGLTINYRKNGKITHRDFLGSILSLQVRRDSIGDILVGEGEAAVFLSTPAATVIKNELRTVGREGVLLSNNLPDPLPAAFVLEDNEHIISSHRLDNYVSTIANVSRKTAVSIIKKELVSINYEIWDTPSKILVKNDIISIRGYGKYLVKGTIRKTKKDREVVQICKYT